MAGSHSPLSKTTTPVVIEQLKHIFSQNGFPTTIVSDNGSQFCSRQFEKFLQDNKIEHVKTSPYHPQRNGIVERLHGSLNAIIAKTVEKKGKKAIGQRLCKWLCILSDLRPVCPQVFHLFYSNIGGSQ